MGISLLYCYYTIGNTAKGITKRHRQFAKLVKGVLQGMNTFRFLKYFGLLFVFLGAIIGGGLLASGIGGGGGQLIFMGLMFIALFCGIGGFFAWFGIDHLRREERIAGEGTVYMGKIFDYKEDGQVLYNGMPTLSLVVRYMKDGVIRQAVVRTGQVDTAAFPRGSTVSVSILDGEAALIPGSVTDQKLPDEENLMNPDLDPEGVHSSLGVSCPSCGAGLMVPYGMAAVCPYCGRKVTVREDGTVR